MCQHILLITYVFYVISCEPMKFSGHSALKVSEHSRGGTVRIKYNFTLDSEVNQKGKFRRLIKDSVEAFLVSRLRGTEFLSQQENFS